MPQPGPARPMDTLSAKVLLAVQNLGDELDVRSMCSMGCDIWYPDTMDIARTQILYKLLEDTIQHGYLHTE